MSTKPKKRGPAPGSGGRRPKHGATMPRKIFIRATAETGAAWDAIKGADPSGTFAEMVKSRLQ